MAQRESKKHPTDSKVCAHCGRSFDYRKKWAQVWQTIKYCSDRCRKEAKAPLSIQPAPATETSQIPKSESALVLNPDLIRHRILDLLNARGRDATICPSEVLPTAERTDKRLMERVRQVARIMVHEGLIEITQKGQVVHPDAFRGPIRLRLRR